MVATVDVRSLSSRRDPYFFLSYAHTLRATERPNTESDRLVRKFFRDLVIAVRLHAAHEPGRIHGFMDQQVPPGADKEALSEALGSAQAFVPLCSVNYLDRSLPGREWNCFHQRAGLAEPQQRILPVLWAPMTETDEV